MKVEETSPTRERERSGERNCVSDNRLMAERPDGIWKLVFVVKRRRRRHRVLPPHSLLLRLLLKRGAAAAAGHHVHMAASLTRT